MRVGSLIGLAVLTAVAGTSASGAPQGVWVPFDGRNRIERIHISGAQFAYTALIDYRCGMGVCSTLQSVFEDDSQKPPLYSVPLEGIGPAAVLVLRWQPGAPCNRAKLNENPFALWANAALTPSGVTKLAPAGRAWCLAHASKSPPRIPDAKSSR